jgi:hypothetical protein
MMLRFAGAGRCGSTRQRDLWHLCHHFPSPRSVTFFPYEEDKKKN